MNLRGAMRRVLVAIVPVAFSACSPAPPAAPPTGAYAPLSTGGVEPLARGPLPPPPPPRADARLPALATPLRYALSFRIDPRADRFSGTTRILLSVPEPTPYLVLHGRDLHVTRAVARAGGAELEATSTTRLAHGGVHPDELVLAFRRALPQGEVELEIAYDAPFGDDLGGLYRVQDGGEWYAFTQLESVDARRAFPCFDEPSYKTAYDVSVTVPRGMIAVANAPESQRRDEGAWTTFEFATTRPLPSYLVALAVGALEIKEGASTPVPIRLVTAKGKTKLGGLALETTQALVTRLGAYFGIRYPYEKLDIVAVPEFAAGAMENPGLVTFRETLLLLDPQRAPTSARRAQAAVIAHELAHQWFGDLVTLAWWDDTWLNEGFADWAEQKIVDEWQPSFGARKDAAVAIQGVMDVDALSTARRVRQPVTSTSEAMEAFDGLTYDKGAAILRMIEQWIGEATFQKAVRDYLRANAWKNAKASDLLKALDVASNKDVTKMASTFLDQTGVPVVTASFACPSVGPATVSLTQASWRPLGAPAMPSGLWVVPVCMQVEGRADPVCTTVDGAAPAYATLGRCPAWIHPNAGQNGYYRFSVADKDLFALARARAKLDPASQAGIVTNAWADVRAGKLAVRSLLQLLPIFDGESDRYVVESIVSTLYGVSHALVDDDVRPAFRAYVAARLRPIAATLGWQPRAGEDESRSVLRPVVLGALGDLAEDPATLAEAERLAKAWLADPAQVAPDAAQIAVPLASRKAPPGRLDALRAAARTAKTPADRLLARSAMGSLGDRAALRAALDLLLTDEVPVADAYRVTGPALDHEATRAVVLAWMKERWDAIRARFAGHTLAGFAWTISTTCNGKEELELASFLEPRLRGVEGTPRALAESQERAALCATLHDARAADARAYFGR